MPELPDISAQPNSCFTAFDELLRIALLDASWALRNFIDCGLIHNRCHWFGRGDLRGLPSATLRARPLRDRP